MAQRVTNPTSIHEDEGVILASLRGLRSSVAVSCGVGHRHSSDPILLLLWCRQAAAAPIQPLAWELPYAANLALKRKKKKKTPFFQITSSLKGVNLNLENLIYKQVYHSIIFENKKSVETEMFKGGKGLNGSLPQMDYDVTTKWYACL